MDNDENQGDFSSHHTRLKNEDESSRITILLHMYVELESLHLELISSFR